MSPERRLMSNQENPGADFIAWLDQEPFCEIDR
jgi:hypothetical protein